MYTSESNRSENDWYNSIYVRSTFRILEITASRWYSDALRSLVPKAKLSIMNEDYDTLNWDTVNHRHFRQNQIMQRFLMQLSCKRWTENK